MKKNILVVDDSALMRRVVCDIINSDDKFQVTDMCRDGLDAYEKLKQTHYDAVVLDVNMPRMDGLELLERIQTERIDATVVMVSTLTKDCAEITVRAMELGAVDFVTKPENIIEAKGADFKTRLLDMLTAVLVTHNIRMQEKPQTRQPAAVEKPAARTRRSAAEKPAGKTASNKTASEKMASEKTAAPRMDAAAGGRKAAPKGGGSKKLIALACSTGGPKALHSVIPYLDPAMDAPMVLVQHMPAGFTKSMAERLNEISRVEVREAEEGDVLAKGVVYVAPGGKHLEISCGADGVHKVHLSDAPAIGGLKPCANVMYESLIKSRYDEIVCVVLTGMGADGTEGITKLNKRKPVHVIAQNAETCVVYGMPRAIAEAGLVDEVVPLESVANTIIKNVGGKIKWM